MTKKIKTKPIEVTATNEPLRNNVRECVLDLIFSGALQAGERIVESQLAEELSVSRTPLREALLFLENEGFVRSDLARGFTLLPLTAREVREIYPMIWTLEGLAIRSARVPSEQEIRQLLEKNGSFRKTKKPLESLTADREWHDELISFCPNQRLHQTIGSLKDLAHRYESIYMQDRGRIDTSVHQHAEIISAFGKKDIDKTVNLLESHWMQTMDLLLDWLDWKD